MRDSHDKRTLTIDGLPQLRGRPSTGKAMTAAERQKAQRAKKQRERNDKLHQVANAFEKMSDHEVAEKIQQFIWLSLPGDDQAMNDARTAWLELGRRKGWLDTSALHNVTASDNIT